MGTALTFILGAILSVLGVGISNAIAGRREEQARKENYQLNEMSAENADERTRALYEDLQSPAALRQQYEEAGLSPSIMFGGKGVGGQLTQGAQGQGATGITPTTFGTSGLEAAQIANIKADTKLKNAQAETEEGSNQRGKAEIDSILATIDNKKLTAEMQSLEVMLKNFDVALKGEYGQQEYEAKISEINAKVEQINEQTRVLKLQGDITEDSYDALVQYNYEKVTNLVAETAYTQMKTKLAEAQIDLTQQELLKLQNDILVDNANVEISRRKVRVDEQALIEQVKQWCIDNGFTKREQNIRIAELVVDYYYRGGETLARLLEAVNPFAKGGGGKGNVKPKR